MFPVTELRGKSALEMRHDTNVLWTVFWSDFLLECAFVTFASQEKKQEKKRKKLVFRRPDMVKVTHFALYLKPGVTLEVIVHVSGERK